MTSVLGVVQTADRALARHSVFGDSPRILAKVLTRYRFGVELFAERLPSLARAASTVESLGDADARRVFFDPLVRLTLEQAFSDLEAGHRRRRTRWRRCCRARWRRCRWACASRACRPAFGWARRCRSGCGTWPGPRTRTPGRCMPRSTASSARSPRAVGRS
ncbi:hypothetical protein QEG98_29955 [Myxococcus sp. MxC21-1]|uniref:hypothetical protein n=1 Tax=Myxococcus sp. MxC21-1 TaxID=3041439 RepID=UPI00292EEA9F|nr:hypothetical protein [Myxococcus sp. MxC21-1]WNZ60203.1 hypothetical protein QEG98_29955 [Myxococcus sp. MxC21-1]